MKFFSRKFFFCIPLSLFILAVIWQINPVNVYAASGDEIVLPTDFAWDGKGYVSFTTGQRDLYYKVKVATEESATLDYPSRITSGKNQDKAKVYIGYNFLESDVYKISLYVTNVNPIEAMEEPEWVLASQIETLYDKPDSAIAVPQNPRWEKQSEDAFAVAVWDLVEGAVGYYISVYEDEVQVTYHMLINPEQNYMDFSGYLRTKDYESHKYTFSVIALSSDLSQNTHSENSRRSYRLVPPSMEGAVLMEEDGALVCFVDGLRKDDYLGFANYNGRSFLWANGGVVNSADGLKQDPVKKSDWYFCAKGMVQSHKDGLVQYDGKWFYIENGKLDTTYSGFVAYNGGSFFVARGKILTEKSGLVQDPNNRSDWYFLANGQVQKKKTGIAVYNHTGFYVVNGKMDSSFSGQTQYNGKTVTVTQGRVTDPWRL